jgi:hypothetical protein
VSRTCCGAIRWSKHPAAGLPQGMVIRPVPTVCGGVRLKVAPRSPMTSSIREVVVAIWWCLLMPGIPAAAACGET